MGNPLLDNHLGSHPQNSSVYLFYPIHHVPMAHLHWILKSVYQQQGTGLPLSYIWPNGCVIFDGITHIFTVQWDTYCFQHLELTHPPLYIFCRESTFCPPQSTAIYIYIYNILNINNKAPWIHKSIRIWWKSRKSTGCSEGGDGGKKANNSLIIKLLYRWL